MTISGISYVALSVRDVEQSFRWYTDVLGFSELHRVHNDQRHAIAVRSPDGGVGLGLVELTGSAHDEFTPFRTGLDHLCFLVPTQEDLEAWAKRLSDRGVDHSGVLPTPFGPIINFKDPDGIALALKVQP
jgi:catechol 2,3-dioxygenase-like lactoylglutathione lyase family enzyme